MEPTFRNDSPRWTDWGFPPRPTMTCPGCGATVPKLYADGRDHRPANHPHPTNPRELCAASPVAALALGITQ